MDPTRKVLKINTFRVFCYPSASRGMLYYSDTGDFRMLYAVAGCLAIPAESVLLLNME